MAGEKNQNPQGGAGGEGAPNADDNLKTGAAAGEGSGKEGGEKFDPKAEFDRALRGVNEGARRFVGEQVTKQITDLEKRLSEKLEGFVSKVAEKPKKDGEGKPAPDVEVTAMKRQLEDLAKQLETARADASAAQARERDSNIRSKAQAVLSECDCLRPDVVYRELRQQLVLEENGDISVVVKDRGMDEHVPLKDFVQDVVRVKGLPELFRSAARNGSPATGDAGGGGKIPLERVVGKDGDATDFVRNLDKNLADIAAGKVAIPQKRG